MNFSIKECYTMQDFQEIMKILRSENGCPWDREQNHESIRNNFLEETYEVLEAIDKQDTNLLKEELGDVLLQVVFHSRMEEEAGNFGFDDVVTGICKKLIHRHPHVFGNVQADNSDTVLKNWDAIKKEEKSQKSDTDTLRAVPTILPALMRTEKVQKRASRAGVDYPDKMSAFSDFFAHVKEMEAHVADGDFTNIETKIGDILFSCVNISRFFSIDSEKVLTKTTEQFINRFDKVENLAITRGIDLKCADLKTLHDLWNEVAKDSE